MKNLALWLKTHQLKIAVVVILTLLITATVLKGCEREVVITPLDYVIQEEHEMTPEHRDQLRSLGHAHG